MWGSCSHVIVQLSVIREMCVIGPPLLCLLPGFVLRLPVFWSYLICSYFIFRVKHSWWKHLIFCGCLMENKTSDWLWPFKGWLKAKISVYSFRCQLIDSNQGVTDPHHNQQSSSLFLSNLFLVGSCVKSFWIISVLPAVDSSQCSQLEESGRISIQP